MPSSNAAATLVTAGAVVALVAGLALDHGQRDGRHNSGTSDSCCGGGCRLLCDAVAGSMLLLLLLPLLRGLTTLLGRHVGVDGDVVGQGGPTADSWW
jgi:hypothetical protein